MDLNKSSFEAVMKGEKTVLVDFWSPGCAPCLLQAPILEELEKEIGDSVLIAKVNVDENIELAIEHGVMSIPTLMVFKNGELVNSVAGLTRKEKLLALLA